MTPNFPFPPSFLVRPSFLSDDLYFRPPCNSYLHCVFLQQMFPNGRRLLPPAFFFLEPSPHPPQVSGSPMVDDATFSGEILRFGSGFFPLDPASFLLPSPLVPMVLSIHALPHPTDPLPFLSLFFDFFFVFFYAASSRDCLEARSWLYNSAGQPT